MICTNTTHPATNRITTAGFDYDAAGNQVRALIAGGASQWFQYDAANRLVKVRTNNNLTVIASYTYGDSNERLILEEGGLRTYYACDGSAEYVESGGSTTPTWSKSYIYLGARLLSTLTPNGSGSALVQYHHPDRLGTRLVTNAQNTTYFEQQTLPFGTALNESPPTGGTTGSTNKRFTTYDRSATTGLDYAINRHYDPQQGRFTQVDPIGMRSVSLESPQTLNLYSYCGNDPVNRTDPSGLFWGKLFGFLKNVVKWAMVALAVALIVVAIINIGNPLVSAGMIWAAFALAGLLLGAALGPSWLKQTISVAGVAAGIYMKKPGPIWNFSNPGNGTGAGGIGAGLSGIGAITLFLQQFPKPKPAPAPEPERPGEKLSPCVKNILAPYFPDVNLNNIRILQGIPWYVPMDADAYTENRNIHFGNNAYNPFTTDGISLIGHEVTHVSQQQHFGFDLKYGLKYVKNVATGGFKRAYANISFEKDARAMANRIRTDLRNKYGNTNPCP